MADTTQSQDDRRLDEAFERIVGSSGAKLDQDAVVRLLVLLANTIAVQQETVLALARVAAGDVNPVTIEDMSRMVDDSRENFTRLVLDVADATVAAS